MKKMMLVGVVVYLAVVLACLPAAAKPTLMLGVDTAGITIGAVFMNRYSEPDWGIATNFMSLTLKAFCRLTGGEKASPFLGYNDFTIGFLPGQGSYFLDKPGILIEDPFLNIKGLYWDVSLWLLITLENSSPHLSYSGGFQYYF